MKYLPLLLLTGCGGTQQVDVVPATVSPEAVVAAQAPTMAGLWTDSAGDTLLIASNGDFTLTSPQATYTDVEVGVISDDGSQVQGSYNQGSETATGCAGVSICYASQGTLTGTLGQTLTIGSSTFTLQNPSGSSLAAVAGNWQLPAGAISDTSTAVLNISSSGVLYEQDQNGCVINGTVSLVDATSPAYAVTWTFGPGCAPDWANATATGLAALTSAGLQITVSISTGFIASYSESAT